MRSFAVPCVRSEQTRLASSASAGNSGCSLRGNASSFDYQFKAMHRFMLFLFGMRCRFFGGYYVLKPGRANRFDLYCAGTFAVVGTPTVRLTYSSAKKSRHILETHWLGFSMSIVIFARGHGSGSVDRQCNNSDVSSGAITGSSPSFGRYCMAVAALPLLRCVWILAASCADWMRGPCWLTMALRYLHARMAALRVLGPSSAWFFAA